MSSETAAGAGVERVRGVPHGSRGAVVAVGAVFAINGLAIGGWAGVLPALRSRLGIDAGTLAVLLFVVGVAAVVSMQVGGRMADRVGARRVTLTALPLMIVGAAVLAFATRSRSHRAAGVLLGLGNGATDVAMNALGVAVEKAAADAGDEPVPRVLEHRLVRRRRRVFLSVMVFGRDEHGSVIVLPAMLTVAVLAGALLVTSWSDLPETAVVSIPSTAARERSRRSPGCSARWRLLRADGGYRLRLVLDPPDRRRRGRPGRGASACRGDAVHGGDAAGRRLGRSRGSATGRRVVRRGLRGGRVCAITVVASPVPLLLVGWAFVGFGVAMIAPQVYATPATSAAAGCSRSW